MMFQVLVRFEQRVPMPAESVSVHCGEEKITVAVKQNFLGNGRPLAARIDQLCSFFRPRWQAEQVHLQCLPALMYEKGAGLEA